MLTGKCQVGKHLVFSIVEQLREPQPAWSEPVSHSPPRRSRTLGIRLIEDGSDGRGDHLLGAFGHQRQGISHQMRAAALPAGTLKNATDRDLQSFVGVASDQLHAAESARDQAAQKRMPERAVFTRPDVQPEHFALAVLIDANGDHHGHADDAMILPDLHEGGVKLNVREGPFELARSKLLHFRIQRLTQTADLALAHAVDAEGFDQVIHTTRAHAVDVRLLDHRDQGAFTASARLEQCRVVAAVTYPRHAQFDAADTGIPLTIAIAIAFASATGAALILVGSDVLRDLELHELLSHRPYALAQKVDVLVEFRLAQQLKKRHPQILGHRLVPPSEIWTIPMGTAGGRPRQRPMSKPHTP